MTTFKISPNKAGHPYLADLPKEELIKARTMMDLQESRCMVAPLRFSVYHHSFLNRIRNKEACHQIIVVGAFDGPFRIISSSTIRAEQNVNQGRLMIE